MEWKEVKLGDIATMKYGKLPPKETGNIPIHSGYRVVGFCNHKNCDANTIVVVARGVGGCGDVKLLKEDCFLTNLSISVNWNSDVCNPVYFYYLHLKNNLAHLNSGSAQPQITVDSLQKYSFSIPDRETQDKIVDILSSLDRKIELNNKINAQLEEMAQTLFKHWFVDFGPFKDGKFVESELGMIPEGWRVGTLGELASFSKKSINPGKTPETIFSHYSLPAFDESRYPAFQKGAEIMSNKFVFEGKTTLISKLNPHIKRVWFVDEVLENPICSTEFIPIKANNECNAAFIHCCINSDYYYSKAVSGVNGATTSHQRIHPEDLMNIQIAINEDQIINYSTTVYPLLKKMSDVIVENRKLAALRDTLLPKLMSGEIGLNNLDK